MSQLNFSNIPFDTARTLMRLGCSPGAGFGLRYRLPRAMLVSSDYFNSTSSALQDIEEGIIKPHELCQLMLPYVEKIGEYRRDTEQAKRDAENVRDVMKRAVAELTELRVQVYGHVPDLDDYSEYA